MSTNQAPTVFICTAPPPVSRCRRCSRPLGSRRRYWWALAYPNEFAATCAPCALAIFGSCSALRAGIARGKRGILTAVRPED